MESKGTTVETNPEMQSPYAINFKLRGAFIFALTIIMVSELHSILKLYLFMRMHRYFVIRQWLALVAIFV